MPGLRTALIPKTMGSLALVALLTAASIGLAQAPTPSDPKVEDKAPPKAKAKAKVNAGSTTKSTKAAKVDDGPVVMSAEAMDKARGKVATDKDRYTGEPDWSTLPPWRQTSFFGVKAQGQLFVYVVDCSGSMVDEDRIDRAKAELRRSVNALQSPQRFKVIFYNDRPVPMPGELPKPADYPSKVLLSRWLLLIEPDGPTDPKSSMEMALALKPDAVFLLSDGDFPKGTVESIASLNPKKVPIHCIDLANGAAGGGLRQIATDAGGQYAAR